MNISDARGVWTIKGYIGEYRLVWKSRYEPVLKADDKGRKLGPLYFKTEEAAECASWRTKNELEQPIMVRSGEIVPSAKIDAEKIFKKERAA